MKLLLVVPKHWLRKENAVLTLDYSEAMKFKSFTGGPYATNAFAFEAPGGLVLFDAPEGADEAFADERIGLLVLTHGHWDHVTDAAAVKRRHGCPVWAHAETVPMVGEADFFARHGLPVRFEPFGIDRTLREGPAQDFLGCPLDVLEVPGHCPGSLCFHFPEDKAVVGGDVLFRGGVGRWDLPGGDEQLLRRGIKDKLLVLPSDTMILPGHGPATTIAEETDNNIFLRG